MKKKIDEKELAKFNRDGVIFMVLSLLFIITVIPLAVFLGYGGLLLSAVLWGITMYYALKLEKVKKNNDIQSFREIVAFMDGNRLDELEKNIESGKSPYQKVIFACLVPVLTFSISLLFVWLLKRFVF